MKLAEKILEALNKSDLTNVKAEIASSFSQKEMQTFKSFDDFFDEVDVQNGYEEDWNPKKWKPFYKAAWDEFKAGKFEMDEANGKPV